MKVQTKFRRNKVSEIDLTGRIHTVPDQALTIPQILQRYVNGQAVPNRKVYYDDQNLLPEPQMIDLQTSQRLTELNEERIIELQQRMSEIEFEKAKATNHENENSPKKENVKKSDTPVVGEDKN